MGLKGDLGCKGKLALNWLHEITPRLQILLDKDDITINNYNNRK